MRRFLHIVLVALLAVQPAALLASAVDAEFQAASSHCETGDDGPCCCDPDTECTARQCPMAACAAVSFCPAGDQPGLELPPLTDAEWRVSFALPDGIPPLLLRPPIYA